MGYCFMDIKKIKDMRTMEMQYQHNFRTKDVPNAIPELRDQNEELVKLSDQPGAPENYKEAFRQRIKQLDYYKNHKYRSDAVLALEVLTTFTKDVSIDIEQWKKDNVQWLRSTFNQAPQKYGDNVLSVMYHGDEHGNVHCHAFIIPINAEGRLNCHSYYGGRASLSKLQDSYSKAMENHGLERGVKGSSARHQDIKKFYTQLNQRIDIPRPREKESAADYRRRVLKQLQEERAASFREVDQKARALQQQADKTLNQERSAVMGAAKAEKKHLEADLKGLRNDITNAKKERETLTRENQKLRKRLSKDKDQYNQMQMQAQKILKSAEFVADIKNKAEAYDRQQAALAYARQEQPELASRYDKAMEDIQKIFLHHADRTEQSH